MPSHITKACVTWPRSAVLVSREADGCAPSRCAEHVCRRTEWPPGGSGPRSAQAPAMTLPDATCEQRPRGHVALWTALLLTFHTPDQLQPGSCARGSSRPCQKAHSNKHRSRSVSTCPVNNLPRWVWLPVLPIDAASLPGPCTQLSRTQRWKAEATWFDINRPSSSRLQIRCSR